jgi:hypothetical protein
MKTLASIEAHYIFCAPPTSLDAILMKEGAVSTALGLWVGRSIEKMVRSLA